jgi:hypothetical protein
MGSIVSFPILCLVNAAICRYSYEESLDGRQVLLRDVPLCINGDDAVLVADPVIRSAWEKYGSLCGLTPSVGKVYFSREFLNINSTHFDYINSPVFISAPGGFTVNASFRLRQRGKVNLGLLYGLVRSVGGVTSANDSLYKVDLGARATKLMDQCPSYLRSRLFGQFIHLNLPALRRYAIPWFLPRSHGGLGFPEVDDFVLRDQDRKFCWKSFELGLVPPSAPPLAAWKCWNYASDRLRPITDYLSAVYEGREGKQSRSRLEHYRSSSSLTRISSLLCIEGIFRVKKISELFVPDETDLRDYIKRHYKQLELYWVKVRTDPSGVPQRVDGLPPSLLPVDRLPLVVESSTSSLYDIDLD